MPGAAVLGTGFAVPEREVSNHELAARLDTSDAWIVSRTGIRARRVLDGPDLATSDLATAAARSALTRAGVAATSLDLVIVATCSGDHLIPSTACLVQAALGARRAAAFDLNAACSGFIYGLSLADHALATGAARHVLLIGADALTRHVDQEDRATAILFGDGAGAVVLGRGAGLLGVHLGADGRRAGDLVIPAGGSRQPVDGAAIAARQHKIAMNGPEVFRAAVEAMAAALSAAAERAGVRPADLRWVFAHQANARILRAVAERLGVTLAAFPMQLERYGNTGAASIPIALAEAEAAGHLLPGDLIGLTAAGAGLTWGGAILRWGGAVP
jgi:3-oxoacyl-[acyl-carrier-protein] synthase-3